MIEYLTSQQYASDRYMDTKQQLAAEGNIPSKMVVGCTNLQKYKIIRALSNCK